MSRTSPSTFNAAITTPVELTDVTNVGTDDRRVGLHRGVDADGIVMSPDWPFWIASADCVTLVVLDPKTGNAIASHAGRDCLFDRKRVMGEGKSRPHESVVDAIVERFSELTPDKQASVNTVAQRLRAFMTCGIGPEHFEHDCDDPKYSVSNRRIVIEVVAKYGATCLQGDWNRGKLVLTEIVKAQLIRKGVRPDHIGYDVVDTYGDVDASGAPIWWSHRRGDGLKRNGVLVIQRW